MTAQPPLASLQVVRTSFIGREKDMEQIGSFLRNDETFLLTLTGPGGVGKSRLALQVAQSLGTDFPDGIFFVPLGSLNSPHLILPKIALALGIREAGERSIGDRLVLELRNKRILLVLDNFEHLLDATGTVADILAMSPQVKALVTSRIPLQVSGEQEFAVSPLSLPAADAADPNDLAGSPSVMLFVQRARSVRAGFELTPDNGAAIAAVCRRLDGLPLAIELAASRSKVLAPAALLARLDTGLQVLAGGPRNHPARLQTMAGAIAWSYDLLTPEHQALFRQVSVFVGSGPLAAATIAMAEDATEADALENLAALANCSLLDLSQTKEGDARFTLLETTREFGRAKLAAHAEVTTMRDRHAAWYLELAERAWPAFATRVNQDIWLDRMELEHDNLRAALSWLDTTGNTVSALRLGSRLFWFWYVRGHLSEGRRWLEHLLHHTPDAPDDIRGRALLGLAVLAHWQGDDARAITCLPEALALSQRSGDDWGVQFTLGILGIVAEDAGDFDRAQALLTEALTLTRASNHRSNAALTLTHLGVTAWGRGEPDRAIMHWREALDEQVALGDSWSASLSMSYLGLAACNQHHFDEARSLLGESLQVRQASGAQEEIVHGVANLAVLAAFSGEYAKAARLFGAVERERSTLGLKLQEPERAIYDRAIDTTRIGLSREMLNACWEAGRALAMTQAIAEALELAVDSSEPGVTTSPFRGLAPLTARELEVLHLLVLGRTDRDIATALFVSVRTAQGHVAKILAKLEVTTRTAAVTTALAAGIIEASL